jgi:hypothetical protein
MRLILVHGINQEGKSENVIKQEWLSSLDAGLGRPGASANLNVAAPFYGDALAAGSGPKFTGVVAQGADADSGENTFLASALQEQAQALGASSRQISAEERALAAEAGSAVVEQNLLMNRRLNAVLRVIEKLSPMHGEIVMSLLKQAYVYLKRPGVRDVVDALVRPVLDAGPAIVASHSLGTVVTFRLLRELALEGRPIEVPLYVTLGSPLPLMAVQAALGPAFVIPKGVKRWFNAVNLDDLISLGRGLDASNFTLGIDNLTDIKTVDDDPHSIKGYIGDKRVGATILEAYGV